MILVASGVSLLAYRENSVLRVELAGRMEQLRVVRKEYSAREPILREFMQRLQTFAVNNRDFQRVITNNQAVVSRFSAAPGAGAMPVSATPGR
jgi:site-specific DNA-adenine methylase